MSTPDDLISSDVKPLGSPLVNGTRDTVKDDNSSSSVKRRLHLEPICRKNRNSVCVSMTPSGTGDLRQGVTANGAYLLANYSPKRPEFQLVSII